MIIGRWTGSSSRKKGGEGEYGLIAQVSVAEVDYGKILGSLEVGVQSGG